MPRAGAVLLALGGLVALSRRRHGFAPQGRGNLCCLGLPCYRPGRGRRRGERETTSGGGRSMVSLAWVTVIRHRVFIHVRTEHHLNRVATATPIALGGAPNVTTQEGVLISRWGEAVLPVEWRVKGLDSVVVGRTPCRRARQALAKAFHPPFYITDSTRLREKAAASLVSFPLPRSIPGPATTGPATTGTQSDYSVTGVPCMYDERTSSLHTTEFWCAVFYRLPL